MASGIEADSRTEVPLFPQTTLVKLARFLAVFPLPSDPSLVTPADFFQLLLLAHPTLAYSGKPARRALEEALVAAGLGAWAEGLSDVDLSAATSTSADGIMGWRLVDVKAGEKDKAVATFSRVGCDNVVVPVSAGSLPFSTFPPQSTVDLHITPRFTHLLTSLFQLHALSTFDISFVPMAPTVQASSASTSLLLSTFASILGYELESLHLYKELGGRELWMRRVVGGTGGVTSWEESPLVQSARAGRLVVLDGFDTLSATFNSLSRLFNDRQGELWEGKRLTASSSADGKAAGGEGVLVAIHPSFRVVATASKANAPTEWLTEDVAANLVALPTLPMPIEEERALLLAVGCAGPLVDQLELFATRYREHTAAAGMKARRLGTASLVRIARRLAKYPTENVRTLLERALLIDFLPNTEWDAISSLMTELKLEKELDRVRPFPPLAARSLCRRSHSSSAASRARSSPRRLAHLSPRPRRRRRAVRDRQVRPRDARPDRRLARSSRRRLPRVRPSSRPSPRYVRAAADGGPPLQQRPADALPARPRRRPRPRQARPPHGLAGHGQEPHDRPAS